jgi:hypothetical protein
MTTVSNCLHASYMPRHKGIHSSAAHGRFGACRARLVPWVLALRNAIAARYQDQNMSVNEKAEDGKRCGNRELARAKLQVDPTNTLSYDNIITAQYYGTKLKLPPSVI